MHVATRPCTFLASIHAIRWFCLRRLIAIEYQVNKDLFSQSNDQGKVMSINYLDPIGTDDE